MIRRNGQLVSEEELIEINQNNQTIFHGGCIGCTQQQINGVEFCKGCQYYQADWNLPDLSNRPS